MWVEQPVGVGYTEGKVDIKNEEELAKEFVGFYTQFMKTFDLQGFDIYLTGESYAGYDPPTPSLLPLDHFFESLKLISRASQLLSSLHWC